MTDKSSSMQGILVLPHWRIEGGAGYYIRDLLVLLRSFTSVHVGGPFASEYCDSPIRSACVDCLALQSLPTYDGIATISTLYNVFKSFVRVLKLFVVLRWNGSLEHPSILLFTSSVQALAVPFVRCVFPKSRIVLVVQENVNLARGLGRLTAFLLKRIDVVLSITESWAEHARSVGVNSMVLRNCYAPSFFAPECNVAPAVASDILYVGGGARIKGFANLIAALPRLLRIPGVRVICLGRYSDYEAKLLERIRADIRGGAHLDIHGLVPDIRPYLRGTRLLLLPIGSPHFCRPAVEAGFFGKPFVITSFSGLEDFAKPGLNCQTFENECASSLVGAVIDVLSDEVALKRMGEENKRISRDFIANEANSASFLRKYICDDSFVCVESGGE